MIGLYEIRNINDNKRYVGSSCYIQKRFTDHKCLLRKGRHANSKLQRAWDKHGEKYFVFNILVELEKCQLESEEQKLLDIVFKEKEMCYNIATDSKAPSRGRKASKEEKEKRAKTQSTKEWKEKHSDSLKKYFLTPGSRLKSSEAAKKLMSDAAYKKRVQDASLSARKRIALEKGIVFGGKKRIKRTKAEVKKNTSESAKKRWSDENNKLEQAARTTAWFSNPVNRLRNSETTKSFFANPENRKAARLRQPSKLSESDIEYIREQGKIYGMQIKLCKRFELSPTHISNIVNNKSCSYTASL